MKTELCTEDMVVHIGSSQINADGQMETESVPADAGTVRVGAIPGGGGGGGGFVGGAAGVECGRRLLLAARAGDTPTVCALLSKGAPFATDWLGTSPLHMAAAGGHADTVAALLRAGLSRDARTKVSRTALHVAACAGHADVAAALLRAGAAAEPRDMLRMTPLHWAARRRHKPVAALLLRAGADPRRQDKFRQSPLTLAAAAGDPDLLRMLEDALREREAQRSVETLVTEELVEESPTPEYGTIHIENVAITKPFKMKTVRVQQEKITTKTEPKVEWAEGVSGEMGAAQAPGAGEGEGEAGGRGEAEGVGARVLRAHGITLLPHDDAGTALSALQSGRTIVLSDAGKLMLKESSAVAQAQAVTQVVTQAVTQTVTAAPRVRLTATPVTRAAPGVKVFTLSGATRLRPLRDAAHTRTPVRRLIDPHDLQQVKFVQLPENAKIVSPQKASATSTTSATSAASATSTASASRARPAGAGPGAGAGTVKLVMNRASLGKLLASARSDHTTSTTEPQGDLYTHVLTSPSPSASADAAQGGVEQMSVAALQTALQRARSDLRALRARLRLYEPQHTL